MIDRTRPRLAPWALPLALFGAVAAAVIWARWPAERPEPVNIVSSGPAPATLEELVAASDLVVVGTIRETRAGRAITDPFDPTAGIRTTLFGVEIERVLVGSPVDEGIIVEHETALLDGTPITVDGVEAPRVGERALYFLVVGSGDDFPHHAMVGSGSRYPIRGTTLISFTNDPLGRSLDGASLEAVAERVAEAGGCPGP